MQSPLDNQQRLENSLSVQALFKIAKTYQEIGRFNQSLAIAYNAYQKEQNLQQQYQQHYIETIKLGAELAEEIGNHQQAAYYWEQLVKYQPNNSNAWHGLGLAKANLQDYTTAEQALNKCLKLQPDHQKVRSQLQEIQKMVRG
jgi:tetratricopeptide (TPR) repeat protein